jgi:hypothetical protein
LGFGGEEAVIAGAGFGLVEVEKLVQSAIARKQLAGVEIPSARDSFV